MKQQSYLVVCYELETTKGSICVAEYPQLKAYGIRGSGDTMEEAIGDLACELSWLRGYVKEERPSFCPTGVLPEPEDIPYYGTATIVWKLPQDERIIADH